MNFSFSDYLTHSRCLLNQTFWFFVVGTSACLTHLFIAINCVEKLGILPLWANLVGWILAFWVSFIGHYQLTFRSQTGNWRQAFRRFFLVSVAGFIINEITYAGLLFSTKLRYDLLLGFVLLSIAIGTFLASRLWAFRSRATL